MKHLTLLLALPLLLSATDDRAARADRWVEDIAIIAADRTEGRETGSVGYMLAAEHVVQRFRAIGLAPAGERGGYFQTVAFEEQTIDYPASSAALVGADGRAVPLALGSDMLISAGSGPRPAVVDAPLVFVGYGLNLPGQGHDDFAGLDLRGKIAVAIGGGPATIAGPVKAANRSSRLAVLRARGALGLITLTPPRQIEIPWARQALLSSSPGMYLADPRLRVAPGTMFVASVDPAQSERLFAGSGHSFAALAALSDASARMPTFTLPFTLRATVVAGRRRLNSPNLIARLEGSDPKLKAEHVVVSAHLDHVGIGKPIDGDRIYNGAMDDASGVATVLDIAAQMRAGRRPKRSMLFVIVTAEEKGLLGSHYFAQTPTVPRRSIVADLNFDMPLPLWPLRAVQVQGEGESSLGPLARTVAARQGLTIAPDALPERNGFVRTDQYSFVRAGIPSVAFKFGFAKGTPEFEIERAWRANRYHAPSDDPGQPGVLKAEAIRLNDFVAALAVEIANAPARPTWNADSVFAPPGRR